jgi:hypothetical protein
LRALLDRLRRQQLTEHIPPRFAFPGILLRGAEFHFVYRSDTQDGSYEVLNSGQEVRATTFDDLTVVPGTTYWYKVTAANPAGESELSETVPDSGYASEPAPDPDPDPVTPPTGTQLPQLDAWTDHSIATGETKWIYFQATGGVVYNVYWDDAFEGSGAYTAVLRGSAYRQDMTTPYYDSAPTGYDPPNQITAAATELVYLKFVTDGR